MAELILASNSPRRQELLRQLRRPFRVIPPDADESFPPGIPPEQVAELLAVRKAEAVARSLSCGIVLGADTLVAVAGKIIGKPNDEAHAHEILRQLSSQPHEVITGICLMDVASGRRRVASERTRVTMRAMSESEIAQYVASGEAMGKAGAYAIQETGDRFVQRVNGSFSNVVGLPLELLARLLDEMERPE